MDEPARFRGHHPSPVPEGPFDFLISEERAELYRQVLARRTGRLAVVVENCHDPHNATAVSRSCDAFGVSRLHVITHEHTFRVNRRVSQGAHRYVDIRPHGTIQRCYEALREEGFAILASDLRAEAPCDPRGIEELLETRPVALVFGSERDGLSKEAVEGADGCFLIPMVGFSRSLNLSVSVAVILFHLRRRVLLEDRTGDLSPEEQASLYDSWVRKHKKRAIDGIEGRTPPPDEAATPYDEYEVK